MRQVNVPITLELADDVEQYQLLSFILEYDPDAFEIDISATKKSLNGAFDIKNVEVEEDGKLSVSLLNSEPLSESGDMGSVVMKILDKASGSYDLTISNEKLVYANEETSEETNFDVTSNNGSIFVNVPLESVSLEKTAFDFDLGATDNKTADILVNYLPADTTDAKNYSFVSNNTDIVTRG